MKIRITKNFLIFREEAKKLEKISKATLEKFDLVYLGFSKVEFISRSFLDELLNIMAKEKRIKIVNLKPHLAKFFRIVKDTKQKTKKIIEKW